jgi:hypothetical protein
MNLFEKTRCAVGKIDEWPKREEEFVKRTAYSLIACLAWHDKLAGDDKFLAFLPAVKNGAVNERNFVKKAVNWALRSIGKRNPNLNWAARHLAAVPIQTPCAFLRAGIPVPAPGLTKMDLPSMIGNPTIKEYTRWLHYRETSSRPGTGGKARSFWRR